VNLVDGDASVGGVQYLIVHVRVEVTLATEHFLNPCVAPARPVMRGKHDLGLQAETVERLSDMFRPVERIPYQRAAQRVDVMHWRTAESRSRKDQRFRLPARLANDRDLRDLVAVRVLKIKVVPICVSSQPSKFSRMARSTSRCR
jgi:hypothetical protein